MASASSYANTMYHSVKLTQTMTQAALFASFLSPFFVETIGLLQPDPLDVI